MLKGLKGGGIRTLTTLSQQSTSQFHSSTQALHFLQQQTGKVIRNYKTDAQYDRDGLDTGEVIESVLLRFQNFCWWSVSVVFFGKKQGFGFGFLTNVLKLNAYSCTVQYP